jgi:hypothetical protein
MEPIKVASFRCRRQQLILPMWRCGPICRKSCWWRPDRLRFRGMRMRIWSGTIKVKLAVALTAFGAAFANASEVYTYQGNDYTNIYYQPGYSYTLNDNITISFTVPNPIAANFVGDVSPTAFSISDGVETYTESSNVSSLFYIGENSQGEIMEWAIVTATNENSSSTSGNAIWSVNNVGVSLNNIPYQLFNTPLYINTGWDAASYYVGCQFPSYCGEQSRGENFSDPGTWTYSPALVATTPIPQTLYLFISGLTGLALIGKRRAKKKTAATAAA